MSNDDQIKLIDKILYLLAIGVVFYMVYIVGCDVVTIIVMALRKALQQ